MGVLEVPECPSGARQGVGMQGRNDAEDGSSIPQPMSRWQQGLPCHPSSAG